MLDPVHSGVDQERIGNVRICHWIGRAQLSPAVFAHCRRNADQLGTVFRRPRHVERRFVMAEAAVGFLTGVHKQGHVPDMCQNPCDDTGQRLGDLITFDRDVDVHSVSVPIRQRLRRETGTEPVLSCRSADHRVKGDGVVGGGEGG